MEYDSFENLVKMTNAANQTTKYRYDVLNRSVETTYPNSDSETYRYDSRSNLVEWNRGGQVISYVYDELSRLISLDSPGTSDSLGWQYDELGRVSSMRESSGATTEMSYTANDLVASILRSDGKEIRYGYDSNDRLEQILDQQGEATNYDYNERNEVVEASHDGQTIAYRYDPVGRRIGSTLPNGIQCRQDFDERNRLIYLNYQKGARPVLSYKYAHNQLGQRVAEEKTSAEQCKLTRYCFNARRELIQSNRQVGRGCGVVTNYRYDLNHNRTGQNQFRCQHNAADQLQDYPGPSTAATLAYNPQGQTTQFGNLALTYNQSQQIKTAQNGATNARYEYDASGRRMAKEVNGEREEYLMLGQEVLKTFSGDGQVKADYFLGLGREGIKTNGSWKFYLSDGLGSTALLTDGSGNTVAAYDYEDYGATTQIAGAAGVYNPYRYTGQEWDAELGMYNLRARHYSPSLGRFLARDPIGYAGGTNLMAYCQGDPIDFADPSGLTKTVTISTGPNIEYVNFNLIKDYLQSALSTTVNLGSSASASTSNSIRAYIAMTGVTNKIGSISWELGHTAFNASTLLGGSLRENYNASSGKVIAIGQWLEIHPTWTYAQAEAKARELFYTNAALHELGHALAGMGDSEDAEGVMSYANFKIGNPAAFLTLLPLPSNFLSAIKALLCE